MIDNLEEILKLQYDFEIVNKKISDMSEQEYNNLENLYSIQINKLDKEIIKHELITNKIKNEIIKYKQNTK